MGTNILRLLRNSTPVFLVKCNRNLLDFVTHLLLIALKTPTTKNIFPAERENNQALRCR
eukprot:m.639241 g.639241  ORF g.639241 m.639241 type:complete len:59 (+) comp58332_c0_seq16:83-259(+)